MTRKRCALWIQSVRRSERETLDDDGRADTFRTTKNNPRRSEIVRGTEAPRHLELPRARSVSYPPARVHMPSTSQTALALALLVACAGVDGRNVVSSASAPAASAPAFAPSPSLEDPDDVPDSLGGLVPLPPRSSPPTLEDELFACRATCHDEAWDPVCVRGRTYANACWSECSSALGGSPADASSSPSRAGACDAKPSDECVRACVSRWGKGEEGNFGWRPACGEDGVTYTTACFASCSGVRFARGECHDLSRA